MTIFKHKRSGERISMDRIVKLVKIYGLDGKIAINEKVNYNPFSTDFAEKCSPSIYKLIEIPFNDDFEIDKSNELTEDDLIEIIYETKPSRVRDKVYKILKEMRNSYGV